METEKHCGMTSFAEGYIFSCDLRNSSNKEVLERGTKEVAAAMKDPPKVRLMECIGVNPWKEKPVGWTPPTKEECAALEQRLGVVGDAEKAAPLPLSSTQ